MLLGEGDRAVAGHAAVTHRRDAGKLRSQRPDADLETHLVVALTGAAMRDGVGAMGARCCYEVLDDERPGKRRDQRIAVHVKRIGTNGRADEVTGELLTRVDDDRLHGAALESALADRLEVLPALADVDGDGDDLGAGGLRDPADGDGGVQASRVGQHHAPARLAGIRVRGRRWAVDGGHEKTPCNC